MKAQVRHVADHGKTYDALAFVCPGCALDGSSGLHVLPVNTTATSPAWEWNGDVEAPTISPSILTHGGADTVCHSFLRGGVFEFLGDCSHDLAGQHVPMPDLPDWFTDQ